MRNPQTLILPLTAEKNGVCLCFSRKRTGGHGHLGDIYPKHLPLIPETLSPISSRTLVLFLGPLPPTLLPFLHSLSSVTLFLPLPLYFQNQSCVCLVKTLSDFYSASLLIIYKVSFTLIHENSDFSLLLYPRVFSSPTLSLTISQLLSFNLQTADFTNFTIQTNALKGTKM